MRFIRHPKTTQERRASLDAKEQGVNPRAKRTDKNLPNAYDDIFVHDSKKQHLSWKRLRHTKYKP
jgi:hypothetical protein